GLSVVTCSSRFSSVGVGELKNERTEPYLVAFTGIEFQSKTRDSITASPAAANAPSSMARAGRAAIRFLRVIILLLEAVKWGASTERRPEAAMRAGDTYTGPARRRARA